MEGRESAMFISRGKRKQKSKKLTQFERFRIQYIPLVLILTSINVAVLTEELSLTSALDRGLRVHVAWPSSKSCSEKHVRGYLGYGSAHSYCGVVQETYHSHYQNLNGSAAHLVCQCHSTTAEQNSLHVMTNIPERRFDGHSVLDCRGAKLASDGRAKFSNP